MIIKISKIISCSSDHPLYPSSNLLEHPPKSSWRCAKPNELIATIIFQLAESYCITGVEIGNYRSCLVVVEASTSEEPDKWMFIVNHKFLSHDEVVNGNFRDQVQLFTKRELNAEAINIKFDRVKITCMQSANPREIFGLNFIIFKTEVAIDVGLDIFGRFKLKEQNDIKIGEFKQKYLQVFKNRNNIDTLKEKIIELNSNKKQKTSYSKAKPIIDKLHLENNKDELQLGSTRATKFKNHFKNKRDSTRIQKNVTSKLEINPMTKILFGEVSNLKLNNKVEQLNNYFDNIKVKNQDCLLCNSKKNEICKVCKLLPKSKLLIKEKNVMKLVEPQREFNKLFADVSFSLSGYVNPQRDDIRRKALKMGAKYIINPNLIDNKCTHLICCFKKTPKSEQLRGHCKIVSHRFIEDSYNKKKRMPWRRYALDSIEQNKPESENEIEAFMSKNMKSIYDQDTDSDTYNYQE